MDYFNIDIKTRDLSEYEYYLNRVVKESYFKKEMSEDDKLAKVLLFNINFYRTYNFTTELVNTTMILDYYADVVQDRNDIFQRQIISLERIPKKIRKNLFKEFKECNKTIEKVLKNGGFTTEDAEENKIAQEQSDLDDNNQSMVSAVGFSLEEDFISTEEDFEIGE